MWNIRLKQLREKGIKSGITQKRLGDELGKERSLISKYESGTREPDIADQNRIVNFFDITYDYFHTGIPEDIEAYREVQTELSEGCPKKVPMMQVIQRCAMRGRKEILKDRDIVDLYLKKQGAESFAMQDLEKINRQMLNCRYGSKDPAIKLKAIAKQLRIWGVYNELQLDDEDIDFIEQVIEFRIFQKQNKNNEVEGV